MPYVSGRVANGWAVVDVVVGVSRTRRRLLRKHAFPIPAAVHVRALIDTGASISGFARRVFRGLDITPVTTMGVITSSTPADAPFEGSLYDVSLGLVAGGAAHPFPDARVMEADCGTPGRASRP